MFVFASQDALDELKTAYTSRDAANREIVALMMAGQAYMVPDNTGVTIVDRSGFSGWHKVRILGADPHAGNVGYVLDQWVAFE